MIGDKLYDVHKSPTLTMSIMTLTNHMTEQRDSEIRLDDGWRSLQVSNAGMMGVGVEDDHQHPVERTSSSLGEEERGGGPMYKR